MRLLAKIVLGALILQCPLQARATQGTDLVGTRKEGNSFSWTRFRKHFSTCKECEDMLRQVTSPQYRNFYGNDVQCVGDNCASPPASSTFKPPKVKKGKSKDRVTQNPPPEGDQGPYGVKPMTTRTIKRVNGKIIEEERTVGKDGKITRIRSRVVKGEGVNLNGDDETLRNQASSGFDKPGAIHKTGKFTVPPVSSPVPEDSRK